MVSASYIGTTVLCGLWVTPLSVLWFISLCLARRKSDPARVGISWMKAVFPFWILSLVCFTISSGLLLYLIYGDGYYSLSDSESKGIQEAMIHFDAAGGFFENVADILLFTTFIELTHGFLLCVRDSGRQSSSRKWSRIAMGVWSIVLVALTVGYFGLLNSYNVQFVKLNSQGAQYLRLLKTEHTLNQLSGALRILMWLTSIPMLIAASIVVHRAKHHELLRSAANLFLVATILDFIRLTVVMAIKVHVNLAGHNDVDPVVTSIVLPLFNNIPMFILLVLLFSLSVGKHKGLWSQPQAHSGWAAYPTVAYMPTTVIPMPVPAQGGGVEMKPTQQQGLPAYLQVAQQQQQQQQQLQQQQTQQQMAPPQGYYYYPQQTYQQPVSAPQQTHQQQQQQLGAEPMRYGQ